MARIRNILCPVDFFPASRHAADYAILLAKSEGAKLTLLHVIEPIATWGNDIPFDTSALMDALTSRSTEELKRLAVHARKANIRVEVFISHGEVDLAIQSLIKKHKIDFVVMGTHGRRGLEKFFIGSTTERLMRRLPVPVLTIGAMKPKMVPTNIRHILVTTDFSSGTANAVDYALSMAKRHNASMTFLHVLNDVDAAISGRYREQLVRSIRLELSELLPAEARHSKKVGIRVETGRPLWRILPIAKKEKADLIMMNLHEKTFMERLTIGRTAEHVVRSADIPVLLVPGVAAAKKKRPMAAQAR